MNIPARLAVAAAAVAAVAVIGAIAIPKGGGAAVQPPASPTPVATASPSAIPLPSTGVLAPGTYSIDEGGTTLARVTFTVPAGWATREGFVYKGATAFPSQSPSNDFGSVELMTWNVTDVYTDACQWQGKLTHVGSADQLATLLGTQKGRTATTPTAVVLGGVAAKRIDLTVPTSLDVAACNGRIVRFWPDPGPDESGGLCCSAVGSTDEVYAFSASGKTFAVVARHEATSSAGDVAELDAVVASIKIGP